MRWCAMSWERVSGAILGALTKSGELLTLGAGGRIPWPNWPCPRHRYDAHKIRLDLVLSQPMDEDSIN